MKGPDSESALWRSSNPSLGEVTSSDVLVHRLNARSCISICFTSRVQKLIVASLMKDVAAYGLPLHSVVYLTR